MGNKQQDMLQVGLAGLGTVGIGTYKILMKNAELIRQRTGKKIVVTAVSARQKEKDRGIDLSAVHWVDNPEDLIDRTDVDVVVEVIGGETGIAQTLVRKALEHGKPVVTANKALLAHHGKDLAAIADQKHTSLLYEAAIAGGIPIVKMIREGLSANRIKGIYGILNGTCNYILTTMERTGHSFDDVLKEAQILGYAEADPELDIGGGDSGHKLALLTSLAFGVPLDFKELSINGIKNISPEDITIAGEFGAKIKLIGQSVKLDDGRILQMVSPCLVPKESPLAHVESVLNGIAIDGDCLGSSFIEGKGAGAEPTASSIVADLIDIARGSYHPVFGIKQSEMKAVQYAEQNEWSGEFYMRLVVKDRPGVIAEIAPILRDQNISIESLIQRGRSEDQPVSIVIVTHETTGKAMASAAEKINKLDTVLETPLLLPILTIYKNISL